MGWITGVERDKQIKEVRRETREEGPQMWDDVVTCRLTGNVSALFCLAPLKVAECSIC